jgi:hypothetical protein
VDTAEVVVVLAVEVVAEEEEEVQEQVLVYSRLHLHQIDYLFLEK